MKSRQESNNSMKNEDKMKVYINMKIIMKINNMKK